ncbi:copper-binding protein [Budvicia diplopodorum]|uniref:copper-binding protein n=1 Tax=Budvicia diplopodorum TaxID=1119056 RepID=UPI00135A4549|nr:copper-binding protein [Budvicia diplopodorum]
MNQLLTLIIVSLLSGPIAFTAGAAQDHGMHPSASPSARQTVISTKGVVKLIDLDNNKVTIAHDPIPAINWPAMTMRFTFDDPAMIAEIQVGNQVALDFVQAGNISQLKKIALAQ